MYHDFVSWHVSGHYIPQLADVMVEFNKKNKIFNLKGIAVSKLKLMT